MTELRTLRWGDELGLSSWAQYKQKCPYNSKAGESGTEKRGGGGRGDNGSRSQRKKLEAPNLEKDYIVEVLLQE